jgi:Tol biopolymer transport system component
VYDLNGAVRDVVAVNLTNGRRTVISAGGDRPSTRPAVSADGRRIAFASEASTFVAGDVNRDSDVFVRDGARAIALVSVAAKGGPANGPSSEPDISANGRYVVFTSAASNLVPKDGNRRGDVFVRDLEKNTTKRVSVSSAGAEANGHSSAPAISADGRVVSFASKASNLVRGDTNDVGDVFVRLLGPGRTRRVSVATSGRQQDKAVIAPFTQISDLSRNGRYVVFDSEATNLVPRDANRRSDVFIRDRVRGRTALISASSTNRQGNNDSVAPATTPSGRFVVFQSFASNLAPGNVAGEDVFIRDLRTQTTALVNVPAGGGPRNPELVKQLLQRPAVADSGSRVAFTSTARSLVATDTNRFEDVFVRLLDPPRGRVVTPPSPGPRPTVVLDADDPLTTHFLCRLDARRPFICPRGTVRVPADLSNGRHVLRVRAGGPGMLYDPAALRVPIVVKSGG